MPEVCNNETARPSVAEVLRVRIQELPPDQQATVRARLMERIVNAMVHTGLHGLQQLARCADAIEYNRGAITPAEHLIEELIDNHYAFGGLKPADVARELEEFRTSYEDMKWIADRYTDLYAGGAK